MMFNDYTLHINFVNLRGMKSFKIRKIFKDISRISRVCTSVAVTSIFAIQSVAGTSQPNPNSSRQDMNSGNVAGKLYVRDYKGFRVFEKNNTVLVMNKMSASTKSLVYSFGESVLSVTQTGNVTLFDLMMPGKNQRHHLLYKHQPGQKLKVGYYAVNRKRYYSSVMSGVATDAQSCSNKPMWLPSEVKQILGALTKDGSVQALDLDSTDLENIAVSDCTDQQSEVVKDTVIKLFNDNAKEIFTCLQTDKNIEILNKKENQNLLNDINLLVSRVVRLLPENNLLNKEKNKDLNESIKNKIKNDQGEITKFKVSCKMDGASQGKMACFDDNLKDPKISLNLTDPSFYDASKKLLPAKIKENLKHELYHSSSQQMESATAPSCADEAVVKSLESLCAQTAPTTGDQIVKKCGTDKGFGTVVATAQPADGMTNASLKDEGGHFGVVQANNTQIAANQAASNGAPVQTGLTAQQTTTQFQQLAQAEINRPSTAVVNSNSYSGERAEVPSNSGFSNNYNQMTASLSKTANSMSATLTKVVAAAATTPAVAQTNSASVSSTTSVYSTAEIARDKYVGLSASATQLQGVDTRLAENTTYNSRQVASVDSAGSAAVASATASVNSVGGSAATETGNGTQKSNGNNLNGSGASETVAAAGKISGNSGVSAMAGGSAVTSGRSIAAVSKSSNNSAGDSPILRQLTAFDRITGQTYNNIRKNYADPNFVQQLRDRGIQIYIESDKKSIGAADSGAKIKLKDDQQGLFKVKK